MFLFDTSLIQFIQSILGTAVAPIFIAITEMGDELFLAAVILGVYWGWNKDFGIKMAYVLIGSAILNGFFKMTFRMERPPTSVRIVGQDYTSYGFPSGHAMNSTSFWGYIAYKIKTNLMYVVAIVLISLISFSRIYLGVHYPGDVIGGLAIGFVFLLFVIWIEPRTDKIKAILPEKLRDFAMPIFTLIVLVIWLLLFPDPSHGTAVGIIGMLFGLSLGVKIEERYIGFEITSETKKKVLRLIIGYIITLTPMVLLVKYMPEVNIPLYFLRYFIIAIIASIIMPYIIKKTKI